MRPNRTPVKDILKAANETKAFSRPMCETDCDPSCPPESPPLSVFVVETGHSLREAKEGLESLIGRIEGPGPSCGDKGCEAAGLAQSCHENALTAQEVVNLVRRLSALIG